MQTGRQDTQIVKSGITVTGDTFRGLFGTVSMVMPVIECQRNVNRLATAVPNIQAGLLLVDIQQ